MTRFVAALAVVALAFAPTYADGVKIGDKAPEFTGLKGVDDESHSLKDYTKDVLVVCITCNHCPVAVAYEDRMINFAKNYGEKVDFVAINVNNSPADRLDKMVERSKEKGFNFDYVYDPSQKIGRDLGAKVTPEFFVFNKDRELVYHGAMDDNMTAEKAETNYLKEAVEATLNGSEVKTAETRPRGCGVQYESK